MPDSAFAKPSFQPLKLLIGLCLAAILFGSWAYGETTRTLWDAVDAQVFYTLNGSLNEAPHGWPLFWAIANSRMFDAVSGLLLLGILVHFILADGRRYATERIAIFVLMVTVIVVSTLATAHIIQPPRESASLVLEPAYHLTQLVPEVKTKDISYNSFPGDHATVLAMLTIFFWFFAGSRYGFAAFAMALFFTLPRLVSGAHWFTDVAAGALPLALFSTSLVLFTPLYLEILRPILWVLQKPFFQKILSTILKFIPEPKKAGSS